MFARNKIIGVTNGRIKVQTGVSRDSYTATRHYSEQTPITASLGQGFTAGGGTSIGVNSYWTSQMQYMFTGLIPAEPLSTDMSNLGPFYRDIYMNDSTAGSCVDIQASFPFSDYDLRGLEEAELSIYASALEQLNIPQMLTTINTAFLVDGFFAGSLIFDPRYKKFLDTLIHDALQCQVLPTQFFNLMPPIMVQTSSATLAMLNSPSEYAQEYLKGLPQNFIDLLKKGSFTLNPISTLYVARKVLTDRPYVSFLHRILPMYLIEKTMFRGTLVEAGRRQRAMTHITAGDDLWTPTGAELQEYLAAFQQAEYDPLGGWISTRNAVQVADIRPGGDFWKWTDMSDTLVPYKLRALGISESFLSGDASYASAESAVSTFMETQNTFRNHMTNSVFYTTLFPLIAVANKLYKKMDSDLMVKNGRIDKFLMHAQNRSNLKTPSIVWHKALESKNADSIFELLDHASEKGVPVPLKAWMAAAGLDKNTLIKDLKEDAELRKTLSSITGKDTSHEGEDEPGGEETYATSVVPTTQSTSRSVANRRSLLSREFQDNSAFTVSKTGKKQHVFHNARGKTTDYNALLARIVARLEHDPEYRMKLAKENIAKNGSATLPQK